MTIPKECVTVSQQQLKIHEGVAIYSGSKIYSLEPIKEHMYPTTGGINITRINQGAILQHVKPRVQN